jgi:hypothetical protein
MKTDATKKKGERSGKLVRPFFFGKPDFFAQT